MCAACDQAVAECGALLDKVMEAEREALQEFSDATTPQHCMRLASTVLEIYQVRPDTVTELAMAFAVAVQRLIALQAIS